MNRPLATLRFLKDGTVRGLYTEAIDLACLGQLSIERATSIEFENATQVWRVCDRNGQCLFCSRSREDCLEWEWKHFSDWDGLE